jgi:hypothetical protein
MPRKSVKSITIRPNLRCQRIYPVGGTKRAVEELVTVGFKLTRQQAIDLARVLLAVTQDWDEIDITGFRLDRRSDGTFQMTVTSAN